jgi:hypothetical protein
MLVQYAKLPLNTPQERGQRRMGTDLFEHSQAVLSSMVNTKQIDLSRLILARNKGLVVSDIGFRILPLPYKEHTSHDDNSKIGIPIKTGY